MNMQELLNQKITIPSIQRDFAMGRNDNRSRDIRQKFICELLHAIYDAAPLHLDFVYGLTKGDALLPLDGQQRLTMLYLLAWFCGADIRDWEFDYESRRSTEFFMVGLKNHPRSGKKQAPSAEIRRAAWFSPAWELDPSVAGMLQVLDDMAEISSSCKYEHAPDFTNIILERFDIGSLCAGEEYGNIFLKMNARGLPLTSWENLKAVLDLHAPAGEWKETIGPWQEKVWSMMPSADFARNIERLNIAMEKIVRIFASSFLYGPDTKEMQYGISAFRLGNAVNDHEIFFRQCARCFEKLGDISANWSENRYDNRLWGGEDDSCDFTAWLTAGGVPSLASQLRLIFLTEECGDERRVRILLNLLDNSSISAEKYHAARDSGLKFLHDGELPTAESGFNTHQLDDEKFKAGFPDDDIVKLEKHPLVWLGSLSFLHPQGGVPSLREMDSRLTLLSGTIWERWSELYFTVLSFMPYADNDRDRVPERICIPRRNMHLWATEIFDNRKHERLHHALAAFYDGSRFDAKSAPAWLIHLKELIERDCLPAELRYIKFARGWNYCIKDVNLSGNAVRLAWSACELGNLKKMKKDFLRGGEIPYHGFFRIEGTDCYYQIADKGDASWYESDQPRRYRKEQTESGEEKFVVD